MGWGGVGWGVAVFGWLLDPWLGQGVEQENEIQIHRCAPYLPQLSLPLARVCPILPVLGATSNFWANSVGLGEQAWLATTLGGNLEKGFRNPSF